MNERRAVEVRAIGVDEWPAWRALRLAALREAPYAFGSTLAEWQGAGDTEQRWRTRLSSVEFNLVAFLDGRAAGMASGTTPDADRIVELVSMWVAPFARGRGAGDALVASVADRARALRAAALALDVVESSACAIALYRRHGFLDAGTLTGDASAPCERRMVLDLGASAH